MNGRLFAALANGTIAVFHRNSGFILIPFFFFFYKYINIINFIFKDGTWSESGYNVIQLENSNDCSVCYLINVDKMLWAAYRNCVIIINPESLKVEVLLFFFLFLIY